MEIRSARSDAGRWSDALKITSLIVNWNCTADTLRTAQFVLDQGGHCVVVDNASDEVGELDALLAASVGLAGLDVLQNSSNLGYAGGVNRGLRYARDCSFTHVLVLNPDAFLTVPIYDQLIEYSSNHPDVGAIGIAQERAPDPDTQGERYPSACMLSGPNATAIADLMELDHGVHSVDVVTGACLLINLEAATSVGFLNERYFHYKEEFEFTARLTREGYDVRYLASPVLRHFGGGSLQKESPAATYYRFRNEFLYARWNHGLTGMLRATAAQRSVVRSLFAANAPVAMRKAVVYGIWDAMRGNDGKCRRAL